MLRYRENSSSKPVRRMPSFLGAALITFALFACLAAPALAVETHPFTGITIGPDGKAAAGQFTELTSVTVDPSSGDLYVLDAANNGRLYKFDSEGEPLDFSATGTNFIEGTGGSVNVLIETQIAIAPAGAAGGTAGDIYIANSEEVKIYSPAGLELGQITETFGNLCGVAVDATGNVFIKEGRNNNGNPSVRRYTPSTNPFTKADESGQSIPVESSCNIAVDGKGRVYVSTSRTDLPLWKLDSLTAETLSQVDPNSSTVAAEPATDDVYSSKINPLARTSEITQYGEDGSLISRFGEGRLVEASGVSVAGSNGDVYVANRRVESRAWPGRVDIYGPLVDLPSTVARPADAIAKTTAVLHGTIDADGGPAATCEFEYTTQAAFEAERFAGASAKPCAPGGPFTGNTAEPVSAALSGLTAGTGYRFRLVGQNANGSLGSDEDGSAPGEVPSFETVPAFKVQTGAVTSLTGTSVTLTGSINPEEVSVNECFFEYGKTTAYGSSVPCEAPGPAEIGSGNAPVAVHAAVPGLTGSTEYHFRLVGGSAEFGGILVRGGDVAFGTLGKPQVLSQAFSGVGSSTATISGSINPHSASTVYFVEYVPAAAFEESGYATATRVPGGGVPVGSGFTGVGVSQELGGLVPGTKYHVRLYAENTVGHAEGPDQVFTTKLAGPVFGPCPANEAFRVEWSAALPDCRAYEQASSPAKNGNSVAGIYPLMSAAEVGSAVTFYSPAGALPPAERGGTQTYSTYLASRDAAADSWSSQRLLPPEELGEEAEYLGSTPDLRYAVVEAGPLVEAGLYVIDTASGSVTQIVPSEPKTARSKAFAFRGASADGSRIFFESKLALDTTPANPTPAAGHVNLYLWERSTGDVSLVGVLPTSEGGVAPPAGAFAGTYEWYGAEDPSEGGGFNNPSLGQFEPLVPAGAISANGNQAFFTAAGSGQLYLRRGLAGSTPTTVRISTPNSGVVSSSGEYPAAFLEATPDGSHAFFMSREKLTANAAGGENEADRDLYRWEEGAPGGHALVDIAPNAEVQGLLGVSSAGTAGYFIARRVLAAHAEAGGENLYRFSEKPAGGFRITFIATLVKGQLGEGMDRRNVSPKVAFGYQFGKTSRVSEDGETLLFTSSKQLTAYNNFNLEGMDCVGGLCPELYLYSASTGSILCVSCDPSGETPLGGANLQDRKFNAFFELTMPPAISISRNLSANGTRVFFQTPDSLVAADENGKAGCAAFGGQPGKHNLEGPGRCQDVYEWEAVGTGSCQQEEANGGCLYLLSTGQSADPSYFVGASKDGSNAFIATTSRLVPADGDQVADVYDVLEGGGLASQWVRPSVPCNSAGACKGSGSPSPPQTSPATPSVQGPGNVKPKQCKKGFVAKKGKCVKKKARRHHRKKGKNRKKKHEKQNRATGKRSGGAK